MRGRVLIVDDENILRRALKSALEGDGVEIALADSAEDALKRQDKERFDIIVTDLKMPGMSGLDLLKAVKLGENNIKGIIMTAYSTQETAIEAIKTGVFDYLIKPFKVEDLKASVNRAFEALDKGGMSLKNHKGIETMSSMFSGARVIKDTGGRPIFQLGWSKLEAVQDLDFNEDAGKGPSDIFFKIEEACLSAGLLPMDAYKTALSAYEAVYNARRHSAGIDMVKAFIMDREVAVVVQDRGGFDVSGCEDKAVDMAEMRGLAIIKAFMDRVFIQSREGSGTTVFMSKRSS